MQYKVYTFSISLMERKAQVFPSIQVPILGFMTLGFILPAALGIFLFTTASRMPLEPIHHPIQWVPGALSLGVKRPGCEADHSPRAEVKE
jgi:hypothetical protein